MKGERTYPWCSPSRNSPEPLVAEFSLTLAWRLVRNLLIYRTKGKGIPSLMSVRLGEIQQCHDRPQRQFQLKAIANGLGNPEDLVFREELCTEDRLILFQQSVRLS